MTPSTMRKARTRGRSGSCTGRSYLRILWQNASTFINVLLFAMCSVLIWMGRLDDAVLTASLVLMNVVVGVTRGCRAKRMLAQIALLTRPTATVVRDGQER
jgi:cation-transporting ATPase E